MDFNPVNIGAKDRAEDKESRAHAPEAGADTPSDTGHPDGRDERGRFTAGNQAAMTTGEYSARVRLEALETEAALAALDERRAVIEADLGGPDALSAITRDMVGRYVELSALGDWFVARLLAKGPLTTADRTRQMLGSYLQVLDRQHRHAALLGLERRAKRAPSAHELLQQP